MTYFRISLALAAVAVMTVPADAQSYRTLGTRRGAVAGAVIGGIIGAQNNEAAAGIIVGGLVGGVAGRAVGNQKDRAYYGGNYGHSGYYQQPRYYAPTPTYYSRPSYNYHYQSFAPSYGGYYRPSCGGW